MPQPDLRTLIRYCPRELCGDPVRGLGGAVQYSKRQLNFEGFFHSVYAKYVCPVCEYTRLFRISLWGGDYIARDVATANRETVTVVTALIIAVLLLWGGMTLHNRAVQTERTQDLEAAIQATRDYIDVRAERADVYENVQVRVLLSAQISADARVDSAAFTHISGYFLDQDGTRYDPRVMLANGTQKSPEDAEIITIVPGETYRYYLVAPLQRQPDSDFRSSHNLKKLTIYLRGLSTQEVQVAALKNSD